MLNNQRYSSVAIILHWLLAFMLAFQIGLGWNMAELKQGSSLFDITQLHKSIGITVLILSIFRLVLRFYKPLPLSYKDAIWASRFAKIVHILLYAFMIGAPLSGWLMVSTSNLNIETYLFQTLYWPHIPGLEYASSAIRGTINNAATFAHEVIAWIGIILFFFHVAGALRHQYYKGEPILLRILPLFKLKDKHWGSAAIILLFLMILVLFAAAQTLDLVQVQKSNQPTQYGLDGITDAAINDDILVIKKDIDRGEDKNIDLVDVVEQQDEEGVEDSQKEQEEPPSPVLAQDRKPVKWTIVGDRKLSFLVQWNGNDVRGSFSNWDAEIYFASGALEQSKITVDIDLTSVTMSDTTANSAIKGTDFFDVDNSPKARFESEIIEELGSKRYEMRGRLRLKNITRPITIIFTLDENEESTRATGSALLDRLDYKIGETGYNEIAKNVSLSFDFAAVK